MKKLFAAIVSLVITYRHFNRGGLLYISALLIVTYFNVHHVIAFVSAIGKQFDESESRSVQRTDRGAEKEEPVYLDPGVDMLINYTI